MTKRRVREKLLTTAKKIAHLLSGQYLDSYAKMTKLGMKKTAHLDVLSDC